MHIKKLEICGFKSFVDRTTIHFDHDVVGIVGPNGCGKSNVVDAIRWCMGEQSPRQLRGKAMEDVIFAGSESRKPHGFAEVTITFGNTDAEYAATLPLEYRDYPEIAVTRRLFRDGTSEYLINKTQVRLKDITDLFLGTGVGSKAYSIIEQGKIGLIVSARPEDRRMLIEEAAGITKYKSRKKQAEKKMDLTRQNLLRVGDIVAEIERNLASLKRQAAKAERYLAYRKEHDDLVLYEASHKFLELVALDKFEREGLEQISETVSRDRTELQAAEAKLEAARASALELEQQTDKAQNAAFVADNEVRTGEAETQRTRDHYQHQVERQQKAQLELDALRDSAARLHSESAAIAERLETLQRHEQEESERVQVEEARNRTLEGEMRQLSARVGELRKSHGTATALAAASRERLSAYQRRMDDLRLRREKLTIDAQRFREDRSEAENRRDELVERCQELEQERKQAAQTVVDYEQSLKQLREQLASSEKALEQAKTELSQQRGRLRALEELHAKLEGVGSGPKALMAKRDPTVVGLVADLVEAPEELLEPFAALLGERLQNVVVQDLTQGAALLAQLASRRAGRATVIALSPDGSSAAPAPELPGVVGRLIDKLRFAPEHLGLVQTLVGDALLIESVQDGWELRSAGETATMVAPDGTIFHADGRLSGGSGDAVAANLLQQKRQLRELHESVDALTSKVEQLSAVHTDLRTRQADTQTALDRARAFDREVQMEKVTADSDLRRAEDQLATIASRLEEFNRELDEVDGRIEETSLEHDLAEQSLQRAEGESGRASEALVDAENSLKECTERVSYQQEVCTERKVAFARMREQASAARVTYDRLTRSVEELSTRSMQLEADAIDAARQQGTLAASLYALRKRINDAVTQAQHFHAEFETKRKELDEARYALGNLEAEIRQVRQRLEQSSEKESKHQMALQRISLARDHLLAGVAEKFRGLRLARVVGDYHMRPAPGEEQRSRIQELAGLIDRMGPVNLDAMAEYEKTQERFEFYSTQKADLEKALDDLERAIQQMNRESRKLFQSTFDSINERFQAIFPKMFRGGRASLVLTNPEDLLETGVDILAQPPGKKIGTIELMSGGEKALTAVSLIFAIFQHRPSPFCVLDEVDAPLDEANVTRFNDTIRTMTSQSQFILITHIKRTMQSVDVLYGVTMQEPGVSKVVSVKVNQDLQPRWTQDRSEAVA